jgi:hypothetical protein
MRILYQANCVTVSCLEFPRRNVLSRSLRSDANSLQNSAVLTRASNVRPRAVSKRDRSSVRYEVFTVVTMKNVVFWGETPCGSCNNGRFEGAYRLHHQGEEN